MKVVLLPIQKATSYLDPHLFEVCSRLFGTPGEEYYDKVLNLL
jgi:hypothetical protein